MRPKKTKINVKKNQLLSKAEIEKRKMFALQQSEQRSSELARDKILGRK